MGFTPQLTVAFGWAIRITNQILTACPGAAPISKLPSCANIMKASRSSGTNARQALSIKRSVCRVGCCQHQLVKVNAMKFSSPVPNQHCPIRSGKSTMSGYLFNVSQEAADWVHENGIAQPPTGQTRDTALRLLIRTRPLLHQPSTATSPAWSISSAIRVAALIVWNLGRALSHNSGRKLGRNMAKK